MVGAIPNDLLDRGHRPSDLVTSALLSVTDWLQERAMQAGLAHQSVRHIALDPGADLSENPLGCIRCQQRERRAWDPRLQELGVDQIYEAPHPFAELAARALHDPSAKVTCGLAPRDWRIPQETGVGTRFQAAEGPGCREPRNDGARVNGQDAA